MCLFNCYYSGLVNQYDGDLDYSVPDGHVMRGWTSVHDNHHEYVYPECGYVIGFNDMKTINKNFCIYVF